MARTLELPYMPNKEGNVYVNRENILQSGWHGRAGSGIVAGSACEGLLSRRSVAANPPRCEKESMVEVTKGEK